MNSDSGFLLSLMHTYFSERKFSYLNLRGISTSPSRISLIMGVHLFILIRSLIVCFDNAIFKRIKGATSRPPRCLTTNYYGLSHSALFGVVTVTSRIATLIEVRWLALGIINKKRGHSWSIPSISKPFVNFSFAFVFPIPLSPPPYQGTDILTGDPTSYYVQLGISDCDAISLSRDGTWGVRDELLFSSQGVLGLLERPLSGFALVGHIVPVVN